MQLLAQDLSAADEQRLVAFWRTVPAWRRMQIIGDLYESAEQLAMSDIRRRFPHETPAQHHERLLARRRLLADL